MEKKKVANGLDMPIWSGGHLIVTPPRHMIHSVLVQLENPSVSMMVYMR